MNITASQLDLLHHTLGLLPNRRESFRNHFVAGKGHYALSDLEELEMAGLMKKTKSPAFIAQDDIVFICTDAGKYFAIDNLPPEPKRTRYQEYLHSEYGGEFFEFLGINLPKLEVRNNWNAVNYRYTREGKWTDYGRLEGISGEWCLTKKAAKLGYKLAIKNSKKEDLEAFKTV